jgi:glycosyltransferase involved in cell wall biosynthesis
MSTKRRLLLHPMDSNSSSFSIGYFSPYWPLDAAPNGIVAYVSDMADQFKKMGHRITIVAGGITGGTQKATVYDLNQADQDRHLVKRVWDNVAFRIAYRWAGDRRNRRLFMATTRRAIVEQSIQIFEMEESFGWARLLHKVSSIPMCVRLHGPWFLNGRAEGVAEDRLFRSRVAAEGRAIASADAVSSSSRDVLDRTRAFYNLPLRDAEVIYPPSCPVSHDQQWRLEKCNPTEVLFIGRFDRHKGGDLVIEAFARVLREVPQARLKFVGRDRVFTDSNGRSWNLETFVRDRLPGALESGQVTLLGNQPFSALAALRQNAMVTTICSRYENAPRVLIEAMSLGCPIVASRVGGIPEILEDQRDGLLHRPGDSDDLATQLITLLKNPTRSAELGNNAAATCQRRFHPEIIASQMLDFYRRVSQNRAGRTRGIDHAAIPKDYQVAEPQK